MLLQTVNLSEADKPDGLRKVCTVTESTETN